MLLEIQTYNEENESKISDLENDIDDLEMEILELQNELDENSIPFSSQIEESVIDYESLIYILNRDNMLTDELKNELDYILKYHNNLKWVDEI